MRAIIVTLLVLLLAATAACADGGFVGPQMTGRSGEIGGVSSPGQKGIIIDDGDGTELLILQTTYRGPATDFAWIVPVPGLPPEGGVFAPDPYFIEMVFDLTQVRTVTDVRVQTGQSGMMFAGLPEGVGAADAGRVTVHRRMTVGDYDAAVLSASDERALLAWLTAEGYAVAEPAAAAFAHYIGRGWQFVALKVRPEIARERPLLADVQPIAIRFPADRLTFPLHISRISAPERTSLSLIVLAESAVGCEQIGWADIAESRPIPPGSSWASIRRGMIGPDEPAMCCERLAELPIPPDLAMLAEGRWAPDDESDRWLTATRMFTIVGPQEMDDLTFDAALALRTSPVVHRSATVRDSFARSPWAVLLAGALFLLVIGLSRGPWRQEAVRLMAVLGVVLAIWGVAVPTLLILLVALPVLLLMVEREVGRDGAPEGSLMPNRELTAAIALLMLSVPVGLTLSRPLAGLMLAGALVLLVREGFRAVSPGGQPGPSDAQALEPASRPTLALAAFVATGWAAVLIAAGTSDPAPAFIVADGAAARAYWAVTTLVPAQVLVLGLEALWIIAAMVFLRSQLRTWPDRQPGLLLRLSVGVALLYAIAIPFLGMPGIFMGMSPQGGAALLHVAGLAMGIAILCFTVIAPFASAQSRRIAPGFATVAALMGLLVMTGGMRLIGPAEAGSGSAEAQEIEARMDEALQALDDALAEFADDTGAFPVQLADLLAAEPPASGLDGSGNRVSIEGGAQGPWLLDMPIDPITRRRDTWLYEVTGDPMVSSGAYAIEVEWTSDPPEGANLRRWALSRSNEEPDFPARIMEGLGLRSQSQVR